MFWPKLGFQISGFSAETVPLYFGGFGRKIVFCPEATINNVISANLSLAILVLERPHARVQNGQPVPSRMGPRCCTTSRAHLYPISGGTSIRQVAATTEDEKHKAWGGSWFWSREVSVSHGNKGLAMSCKNMAHLRCHQLIFNSQTV